MRVGSACCERPALDWVDQCDDIENARSTRAEEQRINGSQHLQVVELDRHVEQRGVQVRGEVRREEHAVADALGLNAGDTAVNNVEGRAADGR